MTGRGGLSVGRRCQLLDGTRVKLDRRVLAQLVFGWIEQVDPVVARHGLSG